MKHAATSIIFLLLTTINAVAAPDAKKNASSPASHTTLKIGSSNNFPPVNMLDQENRLHGFGRDISDAVARAIHMKVERYHSASWPEVEGWIKEGKIDVIHDVGFSELRARQYDFTQTILAMPETIFVEKWNFSITDLDSLSGRKVACVKQHITHIYLQSFPGIECDVVNTPEEGLNALLNGYVDAFVYPKQIVMHLLKRQKMAIHIKEAGKPTRWLHWAMAVRKGDKVTLDRLNQGIDQIKNDGTYQKIYDKWFGQNLALFSETSAIIIISLSIIAGILLLAGVVSLFYILKLRTSRIRLAESENRYKSLADNIPEGIFLKNPQSEFVFCNKIFAENLGLDSSEIKGKSDFELIPESAEEFIEQDRQVLEKNARIEFAQVVQYKGKERHFLTSKSPMHDHNGEISGILGVSIEVTELMQLQQKLESSLQERNAIVDALPDIVYSVDMEGRPLWWNEKLEKVTGRSRAEIGQMHAIEFFVEDDRKLASKALGEFIDNEHSDTVFRMKTADGPREYAFRNRKLFNQKGQLVGLVGIGRDISQELEQERQQDELKSQLAQAQKMEAIGHLAGGIAHDFNNILASILGYCELAQFKLESNEDNSTIEKPLEEIHKSTLRGRDLIRKVLAFSRARKGAMDLVNIEWFCEEIIAMFKPLIPSSIKIEVDHKDPEIYFEADPVMLQQAILNLCINARDAIDGHGKISLKTGIENISTGNCDSCHSEFNGDHLVFTVNDNGEGIEKNMLNRVFEPFASSKNNINGSGMGLAMVHGFVHEHGGHIKLATGSAGSSFKLCFPATMIKPAGDQPNKTDDNSRLMREGKPVESSETYCILIVDDEPAIANMLTEMLTVRGYKTEKAYSANQALEIFRQNPEGIDLVISDQTMPGMTGHELAAELLQIKPNLPIILNTGHTDMLDSEKARELGIQAFLYKPVKSAVMYETIARLISKQ